MCAGYAASCLLKLTDIILTSEDTDVPQRLQPTMKLRRVNITAKAHDHEDKNTGNNSPPRQGTIQEFNITLNSVRQHNRFITEGNYKATCFDCRLVILRPILSIVSQDAMHTLGSHRVYIHGILTYLLHGAESFLRS